MGNRLRSAGWAALSGLGAAGILNTVLVIVSGMGRFSFGNCLPAMLGAVLMAVGVKKLWKPGAPLFTNHRLNKLFKGLLMAGCAWIVLVLCLIGFAWPRAGDTSAEWMIVPGAGLRGDQLSLTLMARLDTALSYWKEHPEVKIVVSGGQGKDELVSEAEAMAGYLENRGIPEGQVYQEKSSTSTRENMVFSKRVMEQAGRDPAKPVLIVSNRYHLYRAAGLARRAGADAVALPAPTPKSVLIGSYMREILAVTKFIMLRL